MGAQSRFEELYRQYAGRVRAYAVRRIDASLADDVVADVFLIAWRRLDELPPPRPCPGCARPGTSRAARGRPRYVPVLSQR